MWVLARTGQLRCIDGTPTNSCTPGDPLSSLDTTCDDVDDDCDGSKFEDYVPVESECGIGECRRTGFLYCIPDGDGNGAIDDSCREGLPQTDDDCDGKDDDCDGNIDEHYVDTPTECGDGIRPSACASTGTLTCQHVVDGNGNVVAANEVDSCAPGTPAGDRPL